MKMENRKELRDVGINMETGLDRFVGNESLFIDFLKKLAQSQILWDNGFRT